MKLYISFILVFLTFNSKTVDVFAEPTFYIDFYGHSLDLNYTESDIALDETISTSSFGKSYETLDNVENLNLINQLDIYKNKFSLDDFGYYMLVKMSTEKIFISNSDLFKTLFTWFILDKKGYDVYLGYTDTEIRVYCPMNVDSFIGKGSYKLINNKKYIDLSFSLIPLTKSYKFKYPSSIDNSKIIEISLISHPEINANIIKKELKYFYNHKLIVLEFDVNQSLVQYYEDLPKMAPNRIHKSYRLSAEAAELINQLKRITDTLTSEDGLNMILSLCQFLIEYKTDNELFGEEITLFPEQTLSLGVGDCEDKSFLFSYFVSELFPFKTVLFVYADHVNVGVQFQKEGGNYITVNNHNYLICDPSFEYFKIGDTKFKENVIRVIE